MSQPEFIRLESAEGIATVTLNRPEKLNALNTRCISELGEAFERLAADDAVRAVLITGAGDRAFAAGADVAEIVGLSAAEAGELSRRGQEIFGKIESCPKPVVAAIGGYALGGGFELALACHLRVASEDAVLGLPEVGLGLLPGYGGTVRLARLIGLGRAVEMILTGEKVPADRALEMGLVHAVVPGHDLLAQARERLRAILANGPLAVRMALRALYAAQRLPMDEMLRLESSSFGTLAATEDAKEGARAFLERRAPRFRGR